MQDNGCVSGRKARQKSERGGRTRWARLFEAQAKGQASNQAFQEPISLCRQDSGGAGLTYSQWQVAKRDAGISAEGVAGFGRRERWRGGGRLGKGDEVEEWNVSVGDGQGRQGKAFSSGPAGEFCRGCLGSVWLRSRMFQASPLHPIRLRHATLDAPESTSGRPACTWLLLQCVAGPADVCAPACPSSLPHDPLECTGTSCLPPGARGEG